ncbi:MAG: hypothetical protein IT269_02030, partial [Saprospiraceae bacterium]|nr:hypothetical protein [Saprospiraceae bacterium]
MSHIKFSFLVFMASYALAEAQLPATILKDINPGSGNSLEATYPIQKAWNYVYFVADAQGYNKKLYKTDGTTTNTVLVHSIIKNVRNLAAMGSAITFDGQQNGEYGVFRSSLGTQQTTIT